MSAVCLLPFILHAMSYRQAPTTTIPDEFHGVVERAMARFKVPGMSIAIVRDGKVILSKGYGFSDWAGKKPVESRTLFAIASNTKAFTATALAILVDEGKLKWDDRVIEHLPAFALSDPYVTRELTVRDLLVHRSGLGLGAGDLLWWQGGTYTLDEVVERLRYIPLATSFRSTYAYDNVLYLVAGRVVETVSGKPWEEFVRARILRPAGMSDSATTYADVVENPLLSRGYVKTEKGFEPVAPESSEVHNAAGGVFSSAYDMAQWMLTRLALGMAPGGARIYSANQAKEMTTMVMPMPLPDEPEALRGISSTYRGYALGVRVQDYRSRQTIDHTGDVFGFTSQVTLLPSLNAGIAILTNGPTTPAVLAIRNTVLDHLLGESKPDWIGTLGKVEDEERAVELKREGEAATRRDATSKPHLRLEQYAGDYEDPWYGAVRIREEEGKLVMRFGHTPLLTGTMEHWQHETFLVRWNDRRLGADAFVTFSLTPQGTVDEARMAPASPDVDFSFDFADLRLKRRSTRG